MLDYLSQKRLRDERDYTTRAAPRVGQLMPDFALKRPDGSLLPLSALGGCLALLVLNSEMDMAQTHLLQSFARKCREVRPEITRAVVVTRPEHLSTVVALADDAQILSDDAGEAVVQLAPEMSTVYIVDEHRLVAGIACIEENLPSLAAVLRLATSTAQIRPAA